MALLEDYSQLLNPTNIPSSTPGGGGSGLAPVAPATYLPNTSYATPAPSSQQVTPAMVNFNPKQLPGAYQAGGVPTDWQNIIASNPDYMSWSLGAGERADTAAASRKAAMRALAIRFGGLPSNFSDVYGDIDPETAGLASANPESESNRLLRNYQQQVEASRRQLAARGMLQSGELGYGQEQLDLARQGGIYDLNNQFLDTAQGNINDYASIVAGLNAEQIDQIRAAADRISAQGIYTEGDPNPDDPNPDPPPADETPEEREARLAAEAAQRRTDNPHILTQIQNYTGDTSQQDALLQSFVNQFGGSQPAGSYDYRSARGVR